MAGGKRLKRDNKPKRGVLLRHLEDGTRTVCQELKNINWNIEIVKSILTGFIVLLISTILLGSIASLSPGEYSGSRLRQYLLAEISREIGAGYSENQITISRTLNGFQNGLSIKDVIVVCGEYASDPLFPDGYYICIFERAPKSFFNDLFRTEPKYVPTFIRTIDNDYAGIEMLCVACESEDVDSDGLMEIRLEYLAGFADRESQIIAIIEQVDEQWKIISPDLSAIKEEAAKIANKDVYPHIDIFPLTDPRNPEEGKEILYGLYNSGYILPVSNIWTGGIDWLYCITVSHYVGDNRYWNYAFVMERLTGNEIVRESDWNVGSIYFPEYEDREIEEFVEDLWGWSPHKEYNVPWTAANQRLSTVR